MENTDVLETVAKTLKLLSDCRPGLPDGVFLNQKSKFG
jgi:hypothetical protein